MKKYVIIGLSMVLAVALAITGTIAYLTDRDSKTNVFTMGNVSIELTEDFVQGSALIPGVDINKDVAIKNTGKNDAWVWYTYAVPTALVDTGNNASKNAIHFNLEGAYWDVYYTQEKHYTAAGLTAPVSYEETWNWVGIEHNQTIDDSGIEYTIVTVAYNGKLASGKTTGTSLTNVYLDTRVDIDPEGNMAWVENGEATDLNWNVNENGAPMIYVSAYAIQAEEFESVKAAMEAYGKQWGDNGAEYGEAPVLVDNAAALAEALAAGKTAVLTKDIVTKELIMNDGATLSGNGKTIDSSETPLSSDCAIWTTGGTIENLNLVGDENKTRGIGSGSSGTLSLQEDLYIDNVVIEDMQYAINGGGAATTSVYVTDSVINGWCSYSGIKLFSFEDSTLASGSSFGYMPVYGDTTFTGCTFDEFWMGARAEAVGKTVTLNDCYYVVDGEKVAITADNFAGLFETDDDEEDFGRLINEVNIYVDGVKVTNN